MTDLTGGEMDGLRELVELYLEQTSQQIDLIETAIRNDKPLDVQREAHSCGGASATFGMTRLGKILKELESQGKAKTLAGSMELSTFAREELGRVRAFLTDYLR